MGVSGSMQMAAIGVIIPLGRRLQEDMPEVADDYRSGKSRRDVVAYRGIDDYFGVNPEIAMGILSLAIRGYGGSSRYEAYPGLIEDANELEELRISHANVNWGKGKYKPTEQGLRNRTAHGIRQRDMGKGIHKGTREERFQTALQGSISPDSVMWADGEPEYAYRQSLRPENRFSSGPSRGRADYSQVAWLCNLEYHDGEEVRNRIQVRSAVNRFKKRNSISLSL
jgi:hypothetical protein